MAEPSSWIPHVEAFVDASRSSNQQNASLGAIVSLVKKDVLSVEAVVKEMGLYLTTTDDVIRARGILLLGELLRSLASKPLDNFTIHSLIQFFTERLEDWQALHGALVGCLALLGRKNNTGIVTDSDAKSLAQSFCHNVQVQSLGKHDRKLCFEILECLFQCYPAVTVATLGDDLINSIFESIDGEMDPECLMSTFHLVELLPQLFPDPSGPLAGYAEDIFDVLGRYFPIHFTHPNNKDFAVTRDDLSRALMLAFSSTPLFEPFVIPLLLEKLSSSLLMAKVDSLKYLGNYLVKYGGLRDNEHAKAIWFALKNAILTSSPEGPTISFLPEVLDATVFEENEIVRESLTCLQKLLLQDDGMVLNLILGDEEVETALTSVLRVYDYNSLPKESKHKLHALGCILSVSAKASTACCTKVLQNFIPRFMEILELSEGHSSSGYTPEGNNLLSQRLNFAALYLSAELLAAGRCVVMDSQDPSLQPVSASDAWSCLLQKYAGPLSDVFHSILVTSLNSHACKEDIFCGVKGMQMLATFPGQFLPISKSIFEKVLTNFVSIITLNWEHTLLWRYSLKALEKIGAFIGELHDTEKLISFMIIVVEKIVSLISRNDSTMPLSLQLEAISVIGRTGHKFMLRVMQVFEEAISHNFLEATVKGNRKSAEILVSILECYSNKVLPCCGDFENGAFRFTSNIWNQIESTTTFNLGGQGNELLDALMTAMRQAVGGCSEDIQGLIVQKAFTVLASSPSSFLKDPMLVSVLVRLEDLQLRNGLHSLSCRDEWLISLFASVVVALRPRTPLVNVGVILRLFSSMLLKGSIAAAQALGSMINKLPSKNNAMEFSSTCNLEEAMDIIFNMGLINFSNGSGENITESGLNIDKRRLIKTNALVGLAWVGKGLVMRGHEKMKDIIMVFLECILLTSSGSSPLQQDMLGESKEKDAHIHLIRSAADAFHVLLSDSSVCMNKQFHAMRKPLYKQHFFAIMMPILLSSIKNSDSSISRSMLYRAFGHVICNTPLAAVVTEAKRVIFVLLEGLSMLSLDIQDKDLTYSLLLVLSGILMDENGREAVTENAHIIIYRLIGLTSYPYMMLVRETAIQCLVAMSGIPHVTIYPMRMQVLQALVKALDDPKRAVRQEAARCHQAWVSIASRSSRI